MRPSWVNKLYDDIYTVVRVYYISSHIVRRAGKRSPCDISKPMIYSIIESDLDVYVHIY
jgi:hypothetical protein